MRVHSLSVSHLQQSVSAPMQEMLEFDAVSACRVSARMIPALHFQFSNNNSNNNNNNNNKNVTTCV